MTWWNDFLKNTVVKPGLTRLGSVAAVAIVAGGDKLCAWLPASCGMVTQSGAATVVAWVSAAALLAFDLVVIQLARKG